MKVRIKRTSMYYFDEDDKPHPDAFISNLPKYMTHVRTCKSFEEFDSRFASREGAWISKGINHRIENGCVAREEEQKGKDCYIKITSLKELSEFIKKNGKCVLSLVNGELSLEIYDDYRE